MLVYTNIRGRLPYNILDSIMVGFDNGRVFGVAPN